MDPERVRAHGRMCRMVEAGNAGGLWLLLGADRSDPVANLELIPFGSDSESARRISRIRKMKAGGSPMAGSDALGFNWAPLREGYGPPNDRNPKPGAMHPEMAGLQRAEAPWRGAGGGRADAPGKPGPEWIAPMNHTLKKHRNPAGSQKRSGPLERKQR